MALLVFRVRIGPSGAFVSVRVPGVDPFFFFRGFDFGDAESATEMREELGTEMGKDSGTEMGEDLVTEMGEALKGLLEMGEALTGLFETGTFTPSVDEPGLRPSIGGTSPKAPRIATNCCCCRLGGVFGNVPPKQGLRPGSSTDGVNVPVSNSPFKDSHTSNSPFKAHPFQ